MDHRVPDYIYRCEYKSLCMPHQMSVIVGKEIVKLSMRRSLVILLALTGVLIEALPMPTELESFESDVDSEEVHSEDSEEVNPEETGDYLDGDIVMPLVLTMRNGLNMPNRNWPNGVVPYEIQGDFKAKEIANIKVAIATFHYNTCIRFVPRSNQTDYISIANNRTGCWSTVGRRGGKQLVNLQAPKCTRLPGTVMHELNHALGFLHEQNRSERDDYVIVQYNNIHPKQMINFRKFNNTQSFGIPYDYSSIMHYSSKAFSFNGRDTLVPKQNLEGLRMGQRKGLTAFDIEKINRMYNCYDDNLTSDETVESLESSLNELENNIV